MLCCNWILTPINIDEELFYFDRLMSKIGIDDEEIGTDEAIQSVNSWKQGKGLHKM